MIRCGPPVLGIAIASVFASCADEARISRPPAPPAEPPPAVVRVTTASRTRSETTRAGRVSRMPLQTLFELQQSDAVVIIDVRPAFFHRLGHIPGSVSWPKSSFDSQLALHEARIRKAIAAGIPVVLYCTDSACPDALDTARRLAARGHSVSILEGGWETWKSSGLPTG